MRTIPSIAVSALNRPRSRKDNSTNASCDTRFQSLICPYFLAAAFVSCVFCDQLIAVSATCVCKAPVPAASASSSSSSNSLAPINTVAIWRQWHRWRHNHITWFSRWLHFSSPIATPHTQRQLRSFIAKNNLVFLTLIRSPRERMILLTWSADF